MPMPFLTRAASPSCFIISIPGSWFEKRLPPLTAGSLTYWQQGNKENELKSTLGRRLGIKKEHYKPQCDLHIPTYTSEMMLQSGKRLHRWAPCLCKHVFDSLFCFTVNNKDFIPDTMTFEYILPTRLHILGQYYLKRTCLVQKSRKQKCITTFLTSVIHSFSACKPPHNFSKPEEIVCRLNYASYWFTFNETFFCL